MLFVSILTLSAVGYYAWIARQQRDEMRESNRLTIEARKETREVIAATERAWIGVQRIDLTQFAVGQTMIAKATFLNFGKAPALTVSNRTSTSLVSRLPTTEGEVAAPKPPMANFTILPNQDLLIPFQPKDALTQREFDAVRNGTLYFLITAHVTYTDKFQSRGRTCVCGYFDSTRGGSFTRCLVGQCAD